MAVKLRAYDDDDEEGSELSPRWPSGMPSTVNRQPLGSVRIHVSETNFHKKLKECATSTTPLTSGAKRRHGLMQHQKFVKAFMSPGTGF
jgi:hypothetical protein